MKKKSKFATVSIILATLVLAGIAVFTAIRLYQLRQESVSPAAPESVPEAAEPVTQSCDLLTFNLGTSTPTPTGTPEDSPTPTGTPEDSPTPTSTPTGTATATPIGQTPTPDQPELPPAGVSTPTIIGGAAGILLLILSLILAI